MPVWEWQEVQKMLRKERMKPYQVHLFSDDKKIPDSLPAEPVFVYENKRYLNFLVFDCFHLRNNEVLRGVAKAAKKR